MCPIAECKQIPANINFPQLLDDEKLRGCLQGVPDVSALTSAVADWLLHQWPQKGAELVAGRAADLARYMAAATHATARQAKLYCLLRMLSCSKQRPSVIFLLQGPL
jgi:hypothetical protein